MRKNKDMSENADRQEEVQYTDHKNLASTHHNFDKQLRELQEQIHDEPQEVVFEKLEEKWFLGKNKVTAEQHNKFAEEVQERLEQLGNSVIKDKKLESVDI